MRMNWRVAVAVGAVGLLGLPAPAGAHGGDDGDDDRVEVIESLDDCHARSFNRALGPGSCVGDGDTRFGEFVQAMREDGEVDDWEFDPDETTIRRGTRLRVPGVGGEFHTFTEVESFGGGCVRPINRLVGLKPIAECKDVVEVAPGVFIPRGFVETPVPPGEKLIVDGLSPGRHKFECLIHPWMHATVTVRADD